jgi:formylmethanofuran dehydrogenase subunit A
MTANKFYGPLSPSLLSDIYARYETAKDPITWVVLDLTSWNDLRKFGRDVMDMYNRPDHFYHEGVRAMLWNAVIMVSDLAPTYHYAILTKKDWLNAGPWDMNGMGEVPAEDLFRNKFQSFGS